MAPKAETDPVNNTFQNTVAKIGGFANDLMLKLPIIGPLKRNIPGRRESLLFSTVIPLGIGMTEWGMYESIRHTGADPLALGLITVGLLTATKLVERQTLLKRDWSSNSWTLLFVDLFRLVRTKNQTLKKILAEPLTAELISKVAALVTYPVTLKAINDTIQSHSMADLSYITFVQNLGDVFFAGLCGLELLRPGTIKKDHNNPLENMKS